MIIPIQSSQDPRLQLFRHTRDRDLLREEKVFIAEGEEIVLRLLATTYEDIRLLIAESRLQRLSPHIPAQVPCYVADQQLLREVPGFDFHRGVIACARRPALLRPVDLASRKGSLTLAVFAGVQDAENLGVLLRCAAALGIDGIVLGDRTLDPFYRRVVRVSMGAVFNLPMAISEDLPQDLMLMADTGIESIATVLDDRATPLHQFAPPSRQAVLFGNEHGGLPTSLTARCRHRLTIPMQNRIDSLNVAMAAAIILYHLTNRSG